MIISKEKQKRNTKGITLIALVITIIVLLILAGVSLSGIIGGKGLFKRTEDASNKYNEAKAREVLETVLLTDGQFEKNTNPEYNQDDFLDELIKKEIPGSNIKGDIAIIGGEYAYELDRSVPKIGHYLGDPKDLIFPVVTVAEITQADPEDNYRTAKIEITATIEEKAENGINRIEIWQNGVKLDTIDCNNEKTVTTEYRANKNGVYTIKAYAKISDIETSGSARTTVEGIVPAVEFIPNGNTEWKKEHSTKIIVKETEEAKVISMKYLWKKSSESEPKVADFTAPCSNNSTIAGQDENMTGKYRLWILVVLGTGANQRTYINGSEEFYFDNEGPTVTLISTPTSETSFTLTATASDTKSGIASYEFYVDGEKKEPTTIEDGKATYVWNGTEMVENKECYVIVYDKLKNQSIANINARTLLYTWKIYNAVGTTKYSWSSWRTNNVTYSGLPTGYFAQTAEPTIDDPTSTKVTERGERVRLDKENLVKYKTLYQNTVFGRKYVLVPSAVDSDTSTATVYHKIYERDRISTTTWSKGKDTGTYAYSSKRSKYPNDAQSGSSWYVYYGIK